MTATACYNCEPGSALLFTTPVFFSPVATMNLILPSILHRFEQVARTADCVTPSAVADLVKIIDE